MGQSLPEISELFRLLAENAMDALIIGDERGNYIYTSPSMEKLFGYKHGELIGRNAFEFFHPEDVALSQEQLHLILEGKEFPSIEFRFRKKNGDYVWCDVAIKSFLTTQGNKRVIVVAREIAERKNLQEQLRKYSENLEELIAERSTEIKKTKEYLEQLVSHLPITLIAWDKDFKIKTSNPAATKMFGFSEQEFLGRGPDLLLMPDQVKSTIDSIWHQLLKGQTAIIVCENITKNAGTIICKWTNTILKDENGKLEGFLSMIQDITEKKKLEDRFKEIVYSLSGVKCGESYLVSSLQHCLKVAFDLNNHGAKSLFIIRENPDSIVKNYNFKPEDIVLLSLKPIKEYKAINDLQEVAITITRFLGDGGCVVVLGGLEYLISRFGFNAVFMMIQEKRFEFLESEATFLVPVNMETLDAREKGLLTSELKLLN